MDYLDSGSLKIQYNRNRYYDYYSGRWLTHDPLGYMDGMNLYEAFSSDPLLNVDPWGLLPVERREDMRRRGILPPLPPSHMHCGLDALLLTGEYCVPSNVMDAALKGFGLGAKEGWKCWADCYATCSPTRQIITAVGTAVAVRASTLLPAVKKSQEQLALARKLFDPLDHMSVLSKVREKLAARGCTKAHAALKRLSQSMHRSPNKTTIKVAAKAVIVVEASVSIYCSGECIWDELGLPQPGLGDRLIRLLPFPWPDLIRPKPAF